MLERDSAQLTAMLCQTTMTLGGEAQEPIHYQQGLARYLWSGCRAPKDDPEETLPSMGSLLESIQCNIEESQRATSFLFGILQDANPLDSVYPKLVYLESPQCPWIKDMMIRHVRYLSWMVSITVEEDLLKCQAPLDATYQEFTKIFEEIHILTEASSPAWDSIL